MNLNVLVWKLYVTNSKLNTMSILFHFATKCCEEIPAIETYFTALGWPLEFFTTIEFKVFQMWMEFCFHSITFLYEPFMFTVQLYLVFKFKTQENLIEIWSL